MQYGEFIAQNRSIKHNKSCPKNLRFLQEKSAILHKIICDST